MYIDVKYLLGCLFWGGIFALLMFLVDHFRFHNSKSHDKENRRK